jgi:IS5 family transposase
LGADWGSKATPIHSFGPLLGLAQQVRSQDQHLRGPKVYALHAPEVECIGKGKARAPYEFGCKVSIATPVTSPKGGQFVLHAKALHGNPFDGHTLGPVITDMEKLTGVEARRIHVDKGYRGHNHPYRFRVWISGQVRRVTASIRREMKHRAAVEPVIGHVKAEHRMDRNYLKGRLGDRINAVLAAAGYNFGLLLRWLAELLRVITPAFFEIVPAQNIAWASFFTDDYITHPGGYTIFERRSLMGLAPHGNGSMFAGSYDSGLDLSRSPRWSSARRAVSSSIGSKD